MLNAGFKTAAGVLAVIGLVLTYDYASFAATGDSLILGKVNKAGATTTLANTGSGPALSLVGKPGSPVLKVSNSKRITRLNADSVDGLSGASMANNTVRYRYPTGQFTGSKGSFVAKGVRPGTYLATLSTSLQPSAGTPASPTNAQCIVLLPGGDYFGDMSTFIGAYTPIISAASVITLPQATNLTVQCATHQGVFTFYKPLQLTLSPMRLTGQKSMVKAP